MASRIRADGSLEVLIDSECLRRAIVNVANNAVDAMRDAELAEGEGMNSLRVFVVDDDRDFAESLALLLEARNHQVELGFSGEEAIAKFNTREHQARVITKNSHH